MLVPRDSEVQLNCSVTEGNRAEWSVELPESEGPVPTDLSGVVDALQSRGFTLQRLGTTRLTLTVTINEEPSNNATFVTCVAVVTLTQRVPGNRVQIIFYGKTHVILNFILNSLSVYRFASTSL